MKNYSEHIDDLIGKYLLQEATPAEMQEVNAWIQLSEENRKYFEQLKAVLDKTAAPQQTFDTDRAWSKVKSRVDVTVPHKKQEAKVIPMNRNRLYLRVAASVAAVLLIGAFILRQFNNQTERTTLHATNAVVIDTLTGGTIVHLNKNSTLVANYRPGQKRQQVQLSGEAFFQVNKQSKEEEFVIETQDIFIRDIGTSFNVKSDANSKKVEVLVEEGEVVMYSASDSGIHILAGESGYYDVTTRAFTKADLFDRNALAYKTKKFRFSNVSLDKVVQSLNAVYDRQIVLQGSIAECNITISFDNEDLDAITALIAETLGLQKTNTPKTIILEGTGCGQ